MIDPMPPQEAGANVSHAPPERITEPLVSVLIPAYNTSAYIGEALQSVFAQTFTNFEAIVINDGSPDSRRLEEVLASYRKRIVYIEQENRGLAGARNRGIQEGRGEYIAFLDSDDAWLPEYLAEQMELFNVDPSLDLVYCDAQLFGDSPNSGRTLMEMYPQKVAATFESLLSGACSMAPSCVVARRRVIVEAGAFDESLRRVEDLDLWLRVAHRGGKIACQRKVLARRRVHPQALSMNGAAMDEGALRMFTKLERTLALTERGRRLMAERRAGHQVEMEIRRGKQELARGRAGPAREAFRGARAWLSILKGGERQRGLSRRIAVWRRLVKVQLILLGLGIAPRLSPKVIARFLGPEPDGSAGAGRAGDSEGDRRV